MKSTVKSFVLIEVFQCLLVCRGGVYRRNDQEGLYRPPDTHFLRSLLLFPDLALDTGFHLSGCFSFFSPLLSKRQCEGIPRHLTVVKGGTLRYRIENTLFLEILKKLTAELTALVLDKYVSGRAGRVYNKIKEIGLLNVYFRQKECFTEKNIFCIFPWEF